MDDKPKCNANVDAAINQDDDVETFTGDLSYNTQHARNLTRERGGSCITVLKNGRGSRTAIRSRIEHQNLRDIKKWINVNPNAEKSDPYSGHGIGTMFNHYFSYVRVNRNGDRSGMWIRGTIENH